MYFILNKGLRKVVNILDMLNLMMNRRTIRKFTKDLVEKDKIDSIIKTALASPSGRNIRPWELIVISDPNILSKLGESRGPASQHMSNAPLGIVVIADPSLTDIWIEDASIMSTVIQLSAESLGLGSGWIQIRERKTKEGVCLEDHIKNLLNIPGKFSIESMIAIGYANEEKEPYKEENLLFDRVHYNGY